MQTEHHDRLDSKIDRIVSFACFLIPITRMRSRNWSKINKKSSLLYARRIPECYENTLEHRLRVDDSLPLVLRLLLVVLYMILNPQSNVTLRGERE